MKKGELKMKSKTINEIIKEVREKYFSLSLDVSIEISIYDKKTHEYLIEDLPIENIDYVSYFLRNYGIETYMLSRFDNNDMHIKFVIDLGKKEL